MQLHRIRLAVGCSCQKALAAGAYVVATSAPRSGGVHKDSLLSAKCAHRMVPGQQHVDAHSTLVTPAA